MSRITRIDRTLDSVNANLAFDEALLLQADDVGESLRFWEWPSFAVVLGAGGSIAIDVNEANCERDGVPIRRRASGGGTVLLGRGCLVFSLILEYARARELGDVTASYRWILGRIREALTPVAKLEPMGISDLAIDGFKVSGNSQQRKARHLLHHGTLLFDFDLARIGKFLKPPEREPAYREGRDHGAFVTNVSADAATLKRLIAERFEATPGAIDVSDERIAELIQTKYGRDDWVRRR